MSHFINSPAWSMGKRSAPRLRKAPVVGPGPGNYNSSVNIGKHTPTWKIGSSMRDGTHIGDGPGPGQYNISSGSHGPKITVGSKTKVNSHADTHMPGPGNYNLNDQAITRNSNGFTMGAKYGSHKVEDPQPGPGSYNAAYQPKRIGAKIGNAQRNDGMGSSNAPGPGEYTCFRPFSAGPKYGFGGQSKSIGNFQLKPGPGHYDVADLGSTMGNLKGCTIGQRISKKQELNLNSPGPGYYDTVPKRPLSGAKIGKAGRSNFSNKYGPGPGAYDVGYSSKHATEIKMGSSQRKDMSRAQTPGPGAYELNKNDRKGITISGYKTKQTIQISPGPGAYDLTNEDVKARPCSAKIGKSLRGNGTCADTPGPGQYYHQDHHLYKFAHTKQLRSKQNKRNEPGPGQYQIPPTVPCAPHYLIDPSIYKSYA